MLICLGHKSRVGKDTVADYLNKFGFAKASFSTPLYKCTEGIQGLLQLEVTKNPKLLQGLADLLKLIYSDDIFIKPTCEHVKWCLEYNQNVVISDVRHKNEFCELKKLNAVMVKIVKSDRLIDRDPNHISEVDLDDVTWDYEIVNDGDIDALYEKIDALMEKLNISKVAAKV